MSGYPNIYTSVVFDLHNRVSAFVNQLNNDGQIDLDSSGHPYLVSSERNGQTIVTRISRNNRLENFVIHTRKKKDPMISWNPQDGFIRPQQKRTTVMQSAGQASRRERQRRIVPESAVGSIVKDILGD